MKSSNELPSVLNCFSAPKVTLGGGAFTEGKKRQLITVPLPSKPGYLTARTAPPRVAKELGRASPRMQRSLIGINVEESVTGPPACYVRASKTPKRTTATNGTSQNTIASREASGDHLMRMMEVVAWMKGKTAMYQR